MKVKVTTLAFSNNKYLVQQLHQEFPDAKVNSEGVRVTGDMLVDYLSGCEGAIIGLERITGEVLDQLPSLKIIAKYGVGLDNIDLKACKERNVVVGWTGGVNKRSVAEMALGFMLALSRNLYLTSNQLKQKNWNKSGGSQLTGKTVGIVGVGNIGKELIELLSPFNCKILVNDIVDLGQYAKEKQIQQVSKEELFASADVISIHTPLTADTFNMVNLGLLQMMKPTSFIINTARGGIINEADLKHALETGMIAGAALDVYDPEPPVDESLLALPNLICTPHTGGNAYEAVVAMGVSAIAHLVNYRDKK